MSAQTLAGTLTRQDAPRATFGHTLRAEWIKLWSVRSTWWTMTALVVLGAGLTTLICLGNAEWLASSEADESAGSFITWGMMIAQVCAVIVGTLAVTSEYGTGMIRTSFAAVPHRGAVFLAKALVVCGVLLVTGTATALLGYVGGNHFLDREGIGLSLEGDVARSMYGSGLYLAALGLLSMAVGFLVRHTAAAISIVLATVFVIGNMVMLIPGELGDVITKVMPGNAASSLVAPVSFNPDALGAWTGFAVLLGEVGALCAAAWWLLRERDA
ncbi:ABC transporter permease [Aeromicrobium chenweiae]|uniref:ABC transporter permease n=1 Tax=Aeromicrobium chenweiae TaxID=2079793 RepID=A0A2S0WRA2_9ACTN|nr:ABC transporter permease [Aeromicrobium chenweiae]AWB93788.1 ABC transporter permease [Aeromicrobium chenweiae]TGN30832.1 ABC transporter permease [Aeromicrobium chenweiae]